MDVVDVNLLIHTQHRELSREDVVLQREVVLAIPIVDNPPFALRRLIAGAIEKFAKCRKISELSI